MASSSTPSEYLHTSIASTALMPNDRIAGFLAGLPLPASSAFLASATSSPPTSPATSATLETPDRPKKRKRREREEGEEINIQCGRSGDTGDRARAQQKLAHWDDDRQTLETRKRAEKKRRRGQMGWARRGFRRSDEPVAEMNSPGH